jgi:hypothetical protein
MKSPMRLMRLVDVIVIGPAFGGLGDDFFGGFARHLLMAERHFNTKHRLLARPKLTFALCIFRATHLQAGGEIVFCLNRRLNGKRSAQNFID